MTKKKVDVIAEMFKKYTDEFTVANILWTGKDAYHFEFENFTIVADLDDDKYQLGGTTIILSLDTMLSVLKDYVYHKGD